MTKWLAAIVLVFSLVVTSCEELIPGDAFVFSSVATPDHLSRAALVSFVTNNKAYILTGRTQTGTPLDCWEYDPVGGEWSERAVFPGMYRVNAVAEVVGRFAYVGLGFEAQSEAYREEAQLNDWWRYDPETNSWMQLASLPSTDTNGCISFVYNNIIYVGFGFDGWAFKRSMWCYEPLTDSWTRLKDAPMRYRAGAVACSNGDRVFFGTGFDTTNKNDWWEYFPETDSWEERCSMPDKGRNFGLSFSVGKRIFVSTGQFFKSELDGGHLKADVVEYDVDNDRWISRGQLPASGRMNATAFVIDDELYIGFGEDETTVLGDLWKCRP